MGTITEGVNLIAAVGGSGTVAVLAAAWVRHRNNERRHEQAMRRLDLIHAALLSGGPAAAYLLRRLL